MTTGWDRRRRLHHRQAAAGLGARGKLVDLPREDERLTQIEVEAEEPKKVLFAWEAGLFHDNRSGRVEVRLHPLQAARVVELVKG
jgi:hypothetical protein